MENQDSIEKIENLGIEKLKSGELKEAAKLFREAIFLGSPNFRSRLLLTRTLVEMERAERRSEFYLEERLGAANK
jgi:hypothetical protein